MATASTTLSQNQIPVIDICETNSGLELEIAEQLVAAATVHGFFYIKNLGDDIPIKEIDHAFDLSKKFFASPAEEKQKCAIKEDNHGWLAMHSETLDAKNQRASPSQETRVPSLTRYQIGDFKEAFNFREFLDDKAQQTLPASLAPHETEISHFADKCHNLCLRISTLFGLGLHVKPSTWFTSRHSRSLGPSGCTLRFLYYPSITPDIDYDPEVDIRAGAHSDYGSVTLLFQRLGQPGLEILTSAGSWSPVPVYPPGTENDPSPPILVNIGDLFSYWTNGLLKSTVHRVIFPKETRRGGEDRYSIAYFCHPANETRLEPVPSEIVAARGKEYRGNDGKVITAHEHLMERLRATYLQLDFDKMKEDKGPN